MNRSSYGRLLLLPLGVAAAAGIGYSAWLGLQPAQLEEQYRTAVVQRGELTSVVDATGTLGAVLTVQVASQVPGRITALHADFNAEVRRGQTLARIDPEPFELRVLQARADVEAARAALAVAQDSVAALNVRLARARVASLDTLREVERKRMLADRGFIVTAEADRAEALHLDALEKISGAEAQLALQTSQIENARAAVRQREAALTQAQADLERTYVRSPVDGVVISRTVETGQNVPVGLGAPSLFTIARDLRAMQVDAAVGEADVGRLRVGQPAAFTVDAFPRRTFEGRVAQIRKAPQQVRGGVAYTVVVSAPNGDLALLPGMNARVRIVVETRADALKVPNDALRFSTDAAGTARVWRTDAAGKLTTVDVEVGATDGSWTEILSEALAEGDRLVLGISPRAASAALR